MSSSPNWLVSRSHFLLWYPMLSRFESYRTFTISCTAAEEIATSHKHAHLTLRAVETQPVRIAGNLPHRAGGNKWKFNEREEHFPGREISIGRLTGTRACTFGPRARMPGLPFRKYDVALVLWPSAALLDDLRRRGAGPRVGVTEARQNPDRK